jgi:hypothetical protein
MIVMERIIVDGNYLYHGHRLAWRRGIVLNHTPSGLAKLVRASFTSVRN